MKTAWELALARSGGALDELSDGHKKAVAEIDKIGKARLAEMELAYTEKMKKAATRAEREQLKEDMAVERASIMSKAERDKEKIRNNK